MRSRAPRGFTLIELMTVLAIVAILTTALISISGATPGTPRTTAHEATGLIQFARLRAEARRSIHKVRFESAQVISVWESVMGPTGAASNTPRTGFGVPTDYMQVQALSIPTGVVLWGADTAVRTTAGATPTQNANFPFEITIYPDGSTTGGTVFFTDEGDSGTQRFRVYVYQVTGTALSRELW